MIDASPQAKERPTKWWASKVSIKPYLTITGAKRDENRI